MDGLVIKDNTLRDRCQKL